MLTFLNDYAQLINFVLLLGIFGFAINVFREQTNVYKALLEQSKSQSPLLVTEDLNRRIELTEAELERQRKEVQRQEEEIKQLNIAREEEKMRIIERVEAEVKIQTSKIMQSADKIIERASSLVLSVERRRQVYKLLEERLGEEQVEQILGEELTLYLRFGDEGLKF